MTFSAYIFLRRLFSSSSSFIRAIRLPTQACLWLHEVEGHALQTAHVARRDWRQFLFSLFGPKDWRGLSFVEIGRGRHLNFFLFGLFRFAASASFIAFRHRVSFQSFGAGDRCGCKILACPVATAPCLVLLFGQFGGAGAGQHFARVF